MLERLAFTLVAFAAAGLGWLSMKWRQTRRASEASRGLHAPESLPALVYFWSDGCSVCKRKQRPVIEEVLGEYGEGRLRLIAYDIEEQPEVAAEWGVGTLPTTFLMDAHGRIKHANNGLITAESLRRQVESVLAG
ncbi:MAG TPA: thioredoxin family protein [Holophagaceae bacterium]|nr:thioredoxin family protein [Holophagaceae bacterium]